MISGQSPATNGMLAGGIGTLCALLAMRILSEALLHFTMLADILSDTAMRHLIPNSELIGRFLYEGNPQVRIVILIVLTYLVLGAALGAWAGSRPGQLRNIATVSSLILFAGTYLLIQTSSSNFIRSYPFEIAITLALSFLVYALVLIWLLKPGELSLRWEIGSLLAIISAGLIAGELWVLA